MILADGGPDYTPAGFVNILFYYILFKKTEARFFLRFDLLCSLVSF